MNVGRAAAALRAMSQPIKDTTTAPLVCGHQLHMEGGKFPLLTEPLAFGGRPGAPRWQLLLLQ